MWITGLNISPALTGGFIFHFKEGAEKARGEREHVHSRALNVAPGRLAEAFSSVQVTHSEELKQGAFRFREVVHFGCGKHPLSNWCFHLFQQPSLNLPCILKSAPGVRNLLGMTVDRKTSATAVVLPISDNGSISRSWNPTSRSFSTETASCLAPGVKQDSMLYTAPSGWGWSNHTTWQKGYSQCIHSGRVRQRHSRLSPLPSWASTSMPEPAHSFLHMVLKTYLAMYQTSQHKESLPHSIAIINEGLLLEKALWAWKDYSSRERGLNQKTESNTQPYKGINAVSSQTAAQSAFTCDSTRILWRGMERISP